jgi:hypothetical protein
MDFMKEIHGRFPCPNVSNTFDEPLYDHVKMTNGNVCQYGPSLESTRIIMDLIEGSDRKLYSLCNNIKDYNIISEIYPINDQHKIIFNTSYEVLFNIVDTMHFSVIFVDANPMQSRHYTMSALCKNCDYMLIHDAELLMNHGYIRPHIYFKDVVMFYPYEINPTYRITATAICSNCKKK